LPNLIPQIASVLDLPTANIVDIFDALGGVNLSGWQYFCDGQNCSPWAPNSLGHTMIAEEVYRVAFAKFFPSKPAMDKFLI
jgi:hypothetical protein